MRGSLTAAIAAICAAGIIPAHAGLTLPSSNVSFHPWDHPRACGAHRLCVFFAPSEWGSSPRMRGSQYALQLPPEPPGIIPAHAGLTQADESTELAAWDHPRACGAHLRVRWSSKYSEGSSPRMRGSPGKHEPVHPAQWIIPAHAGLTQYVALIARAIWDHPRACGAHLPQPRHGGTRTGSSPRMRGSHVETPTYMTINGIIPAHAGLTMSAEATPYRAGDHPRACGAHSDTF